MSDQTGGARYIKVRGRWTYLFRAIDRDGQTFDFMLSGRRDEAAATEFLARTMKGFKSFAAAQAALAGIETAHMIRKGQFAANGRTAFQQFAALAG